jgi:hypothetical protein
MRRCSTFWNGAGSLIIPVRRDGRIRAVIDWLPRSRPADACFSHERLRGRAVEGLQRNTGGAQRLWNGFDRHENHPLRLVKGPDAGVRRPPTAPRT